MFCPCPTCSTPPNPTLGYKSPYPPRDTSKPHANGPDIIALDHPPSRNPRTTPTGSHPLNQPHPRRPRISNHTPSLTSRATPPRGIAPTPHLHAPRTNHHRRDNQPAAPAEESHQPRNLSREEPTPPAPPLKSPSSQLPTCRERSLNLPSTRPHLSTPHHPPAHQPIGNHHIAAALPTEPAQGPSPTHRPRITVNHRREQAQAALHPTRKNQYPGPLTPHHRSPSRSQPNPPGRDHRPPPHDSTHSHRSLGHCRYPSPPPDPALRHHQPST